MQTSRRILIGFGAGIVVLIAAAIVLVVTTGHRNPPMLAADTPEGTVQRYLLAIQEKNYRAAYDYLLLPNPNQPKVPTESYDNWLLSTRFSGDSTWKASLGSVEISGDTASLNVIIDIFRAEGPLGNPIRSQNTTFLLKKSGNDWRIISPFDLYWLY
jgi:hypothetical protein